MHQQEYHYYCHTKNLEESRSNISKYIKDGTIKVNSNVVKTGYLLREGDLIEYEEWCEVSEVVPELITPLTKAIYFLLILCSLKASDSILCASFVLETRSNPEVSLSIQQRSKNKLYCFREI